MRTGVQFSGSLGPNETRRYFTLSWPAQWHVAWYLVPTSANAGAPQVNWEVAVERADDQNLTYWFTVENLTGQNVDFEARYAILSQ